MNKSKIMCEDLPQFVEVCAKLTRHGILFNAWTHNLTIELTGGF